MHQGLFGNMVNRLVIQQFPDSAETGSLLAGRLDWQSDEILVGQSAASQPVPGRIFEARKRD
jgi:hypothetical protein